MTDLAEHPVDFLPELAMGLLTVTQAAELLRHIEDCSSCAAEYRVMCAAVEKLPYAGEDTRVSPAVKAGVMARIGGEAPRTASHARRWRVAAIAAGVALLIGGGIGIGLGIGSGGTGGNHAVAARDSALLASLVDGSAQTAVTHSGALSIAFVHAPGWNDGFVSGHDLPPLPSNKAYQAWFTKDGKTMEPATVFTSSTGAWVEAPGPIGQYVAVGFTIENSGGAKHPTSPPFAIVPLPHPADTSAS